jgi:hypothetical protein
MVEEKKEPIKTESSDRQLPVMTEAYVRIENTQQINGYIRTVDGESTNGRKRRTV